MNTGQIAIHLLDPDAISAESARAGLTDDEQVRANQFRFSEDAARWTSYRAQMRIILGLTIGLPPLKVPLAFSDQGKPLLASPHDSVHFNLSHCSDLGILAISLDGPIGVDLESLDRASDLPDCESTFCHPGEIAGLPDESHSRATKLLEIWTAKEALLKALGTGLLHPPESIQVFLTRATGHAVSDLPLCGVESQRIHLLAHPRLVCHRAAISTKLPVADFDYI